MRKIILSMNITEDGFIAGSDSGLGWHFPYWNTEMSEALCHVLSNADTFLLGRKTYEAFFPYWSWKGNDLSMPREDIALIEMMSRYTKVVISKTLKDPPWSHSFLLKGDILTEIRKLKQKTGKDIIVLGSTQLVSYLIQNDLIDEYCLWVHPVLIKQGKCLSKLKNIILNVEFIQSEYLRSGVIKLCYHSHNKHLFLK